MPELKYKVERVKLEELAELLDKRDDEGWQCYEIVPHMTYQMYVVVFNRRPPHAWQPGEIMSIMGGDFIDGPKKLANVVGPGWEESWRD